MRNREPDQKGWGLSCLSVEALAKSEAQRARRNWEPACGTERLVSSKLWRRRKRSEREETGNPLAGLSGLSRRSFGEDGSAANAKKCEMRRRKKSPHRPNHTKADGVKRKGREHYGSDMLIFMFMQTKCQNSGETRISRMFHEFLSRDREDDRAIW